jgi:hypothetical protein
MRYIPDMAQKKRITDYEPGERIVGWVHDCRHCGARFVGHRDAIYCSDACRKRDSRMNADQFWSKLSRSGNCWIYPTRQWTGYGQQSWAGERWLAHRLAYTLAHGDIPDGMHVLHSCDVPCCCNPDHLRLGSHDENMRDMAERKRAVGHNKLDLERAEHIRTAYGKGAPVKFLARRYGVAPKTIREVIQGKTYKPQSTFG